MAIKIRKPGDVRWLLGEVELERPPPRRELGFEACSLCRDEEVFFFLFFCKIGIVKLAFLDELLEKGCVPSTSQ